MATGHQIAISALVRPVLLHHQGLSAEYLLEDGKGVAVAGCVLLVSRQVLPTDGRPAAPVLRQQLTDGPIRLGVDLTRSWSSVIFRLLFEKQPPFSLTARGMRKLMGWPGDRVHRRRLRRWERPPEAGSVGKGGGGGSALCLLSARGKCSSAHMRPIW
ncbi:hypothetical protein TYRP_000825 [Tyrophagus putrescentiae]|nr:hypothetical protein TYRP_000825 [Tyrophagus putrescentiae]